MMNIRPAVVAAAALLCLGTPGWAQPSCPESQLAVQLLGSGGPAINATRASTSYLVWLDGHARVMIDAGGGAFLRFGESRADLNDLWFLGISHLHPDHTSDLPALLLRSQTVRQRSCHPA